MSQYTQLVFLLIDLAKTIIYTIYLYIIKFIDFLKIIFLKEIKNYENEYYYSNYNSFFFYLFLIFIIVSIILILCYLITDSNLYYEKTSGYECGFDPFSDAREPFYVKFYLISILFIIFDVEIVFFFPWIFSIVQISYFGLVMMYIFLVILTVGFIYEWKKGSLDWD